MLFILYTEESSMFLQHVRNQLPNYKASDPTRVWSSNTQQLPVCLSKGNIKKSKPKDLLRECQIWFVVWHHSFLSKLVSYHLEQYLNRPAHWPNMAPCSNVGDLHLMAPDCFSQDGEAVCWYDVRDKSLTEETNKKTAVFLYTSLKTGDFYGRLTFFWERIIYLFIYLWSIYWRYAACASTGWMLDNELERIWTENLVTLFEALLQHLPEGKKNPR